MLFNTVARWLLSSSRNDFALLVSFSSAMFASISIAFLISACFVDNPDNSLTERTLIPEGLFHLHASDFGSHRFFVQAVTVEARSFSELSGLGFTLWDNWNFSTVSSHLHLDCGTCLCVVTRTSTTMSMNCAWGNSTVFCVSRAVGTCLCVFKWGQLHYCDGLLQNRQWHTHIDNLFVDSLWREIRLSFTVFAGVVNVAQRITRLTFWCTF